MEKSYTITTVALGYPLMLGLVPGLKELCLWDCEYSEEHILCLNLTDEQITAIQELKPLEDDIDFPESTNYIEVITDEKKGLALTLACSWLVLSNIVGADLVEDIVKLPLTSEQVNTVCNAIARATIYEATHDDDGNLIIPQVVQPEIAYA